MTTSDRPIEVIAYADNSGEDYIPDSNFRIQNQKIMLTYSVHLPKDEYKTWLKSKTGEPKELHIANETTEIGYQHAHVLIDFGKAFQTRNITFFDYNNIRPHFRKIKNIVHWRNSRNYLSKQDIECAYLKEQPNLAASVWSMGSMEEALMKCVQRPTDVSGIKQLYDLRPKPSVNLPKVDWKWQTDLIEYLENNKADDRSIIWFFDPNGGSGKSNVGKFLYINDPAKYYTTNAMGGNYHFSTIVQTAVREGWNGHGFIINLSRDCEKKSIYEPLEALKDGLMTAQKYVGGTMAFNSPHVVVMANFLPDVTRMTDDRFKIIELNRKRETGEPAYVVKHWTYNEVKKYHADKKETLLKTETF